MHRPEYIKFIEEAADTLGIGVRHLSEKWAIELKKNGATKYIIGNTFPLNDACCYKIAGNKNLCSDVLSANNIPNVPHQVIFSPPVLERRRQLRGNFEAIQNFVSQNGFPLLIKKNNSTKGEGVYLINNEVELESTISKVYTTDSTLCLSPYRKDIREFRNIVLDGICLLSYEKQIPYLVADGSSSVIEMISRFINANVNDTIKSEKFFDVSMMKHFTTIPEAGEKVFLQWKHNRFPGTKYYMIDDIEIQKLAVDAAIAITARFASVDIIKSYEYGLEVLEMSPSVAIHFPIISSDGVTIVSKEKKIYSLALSKLFNLNIRL